MADWCNGKRGFCQHDELCSECGHFNGDGLVELSESLHAYIRELEAERDRYWAFIRGMGCESCSGDCDRCDGQSGWTWSGAKMDGEVSDGLD